MHISPQIRSDSTHLCPKTSDDHGPDSTPFEEVLRSLRAKLDVCKSHKYALALAIRIHEKSSITAHEGEPFASSSAKGELLVMARIPARYFRSTSGLLAGAD